MSAGFRERLASGPCLILDGGMGTQLMARGLARGAAPEAWNADRPDLVTAVHRSYAEAGSEAVHTNSFGEAIQRAWRISASTIAARSWPPRRSATRGLRAPAS